MALAFQTARASAVGQKAAQRPSLCSSTSRKSVACRAQQQQPLEQLRQKLAAATASALLGLGCLTGAPAALASEFDILAEPAPTTTYYVDDASVLSKSTKGEINDRLNALEAATGYRIEVVTVRKLEFETDAFAFGDKALAGWYRSPEARANKGVLLVVTAGKDGAVTGGKAFVEAVGDDLIESVVGDNISVFTEDEKYNQTVLSSLDRIEAKLKGQPVPEGPQREDTTRVRTYKTKQETDKVKSVTSTVVATLLVIAVVVPMLQYYGYTAKE